MGKQRDDEIEVVVDLDELIEWQDVGEEHDEQHQRVTPPPPPKGEFEGWETGEEDLT